MVDKIYFPQPIIPVVPSKGPEKPGKNEGAVQIPFKDVLGQAAKSELKFSAHAKERLAQRNIQLSTADLAKIGSAVDKAAQKGSRDSLIMMDRLALVVSVRNKTVVTAVDSISMKDHVFTNIDSAVII
ncbi:MAG: TIGR02530 family flagellar biosynthesis protein [Thermincola sp.]|jgi:flagellar operon protein|nr:TIGR02530 family flagellar biosynthesis protein [Thermincola sp.]MDT3701788.1 TIGR02530 family flagellar biosynthesis protein [Thermincola sp.]